MEQEFITIAEAVKLTGENDVTLMRVLKDALEEAGVSLESIMRKEQREKGTMYLLSKDFLLKALAGEPIEEVEIQEEVELRAEDVAQERSSTSEPKSSAATPEVLQAKNEMIAVLQEVIGTKDKHIDDLSKKIDQLIERSRETNILLKGLQDKVFFLERGTEEKKSSQKKEK